MAKESGLGDRLYFHGWDGSGDIGAVQSVKGERADLVVTGLDKSAVERIQGVANAEISFNGFFNPSTVAVGGADAQHAILSVRPTTDRIVSYVHGTTLGNPVATIQAKQIDYAQNRAADGAMTFTVQTRTSGSPLDWGVQYTAGKVTHASATNGTSIDGSAATSFGATAYQHVFSVATGTVIGRFEDSADNVSFAAITGLTFAGVATAGAPTAERLTTAALANVRRYVRYASTGTFTNAVVFAAFTRFTVAPILS